MIFTYVKGMRSFISLHLENKNQDAEKWKSFGRHQTEFASFH